MFLFEALNKILSSKKLEPVIKSSPKKINEEITEKKTTYKNNDNYSDYKKNDFNKSSANPVDKANSFSLKKNWEDKQSNFTGNIKNESKFKKDDSRAYICYINAYNQVTYILNKEKITAFIDGVDEYFSEQGASPTLKASIKNYLFSTVSKQNVFVEVVGREPLNVKIFLDAHKTELLLDAVKSMNQTIQTQKSNAPSFKFNN